jgi:hypothetical protein
MDYTLIVDDMISKDVQRIRDASCKIIYAGQNRDALKPLLPFIELMRAATNLNRGGLSVLNQRFPEYAIKTLEFHRDSNECTCNLYAGGYDSFDPDEELKANNIEIVSRSDDKYSLIARCKKCNELYDVDMRWGHYIFHDWKRRTK